MLDFFSRLLETSGFPPRWTFGSWTAGHGWLHILADVAIFGAYAAIPIALLFFVRQRRDVPYPPLFGLFALFIVCGGLTHLIDATLFWHPWYRLAGLVKAVTAVVSWLAVIALIRNMPQALALRGLAKRNQQLEQEIGEKKLAGVALAVAHEEAQAANRAKDRFLAGLSHELRTPLTPVRLAVEGMLKDPEVPESLLPRLGMIRRNLALEMRLIDDLLDYQSLLVGKAPLRREWVELAAILKAVCGLCQPGVEEKKLTLELETSALPGYCLADPARLHQVFWNLIRNAMKFTASGGRIRVTADSPERGWCRVRVEDEGIGFPPDKEGAMFHAFEQGDVEITREYGGLGLGLTICRILVEQHGGRIRADSQGPGQGAVFTVDLPDYRLEKSALREETGEPLPLSGNNRRILLVEDHADTARTLSQLLEKRGFQVRHAATVAEARKLAGEGNFDLLISDIGLPDGSGCDLMEGLPPQQKFPGIALSGYGMPEDLKESAKAGFSRHLVKPIYFGELMEAIQSLLPVNHPGSSPSLPGSQG